MAPEDILRVQAFLSKIMDGAADVGMQALPVLGLYKRAKEERIDFWHLLLTDPTTSQRITAAMRQHAAKLSPTFVAGLKLVIDAHQEAQVQARQASQDREDALRKAQDAPFQMNARGGVPFSADEP